MNTMKFAYSMIYGLALIAKLSTAGYCQAGEERYATAAILKGERELSIQPLRKSATDLSAIDIDSLQARRGFLVTSVSQQGSLMSKASIIQVLSAVPRSEKLFRRGLQLKPIGPLVAVAGLAVGIIAVKGTTKTGFVRGIRTATTRNVPDIEVQYTSRSLPLLASGIGLLIGGLCMIELSNGYTKKSVDIYNASVVPRRLQSGVEKVSLGITSSGMLGFEARF